MRLKVNEIKRLLDDSPRTTSVSITSPSALARELFTHSGDGTLVRKGEQIAKLTDRQMVDARRLVTLVEAAFQQRLLPGWWEGVDLLAAYISESYRAAAVIAELDEFVYLDKFAIDETARGEGLARTVWDHMVKDFPQLVWRSRWDNQFNAFYERESDGRVTTGLWTIYWMGVTDFDVVGRAVKLLRDMDASFVMGDSNDG
jgi:acetylglutamate kinase